MRLRERLREREIEIEKEIERQIEIEIEKAHDERIHVKETEIKGDAEKDAFDEEDDPFDDDEHEEFCNLLLKDCD